MSAVSITPSTLFTYITTITTTVIILIIIVGNIFIMINIITKNNIITVFVNHTQNIAVKV